MRDEGQQSRLPASKPADGDRERLISYLQVLQLELEMQNHQLREDLATQLAQALETARLYGDAQKANAALKVSEAKSSGIVSHAADAIVSVDASQRIALFNDAAERIFGWSRTEVIGTPVERLIPERFRAVYRRHLQRFARGGEQARQMGERRSSLLGLRKSGEEFPAEAAISELEIAGEKIFTVTLRDVTEAKRLETERKLLSDLGTVLVGTLDYEQTLTTLAQLAVHELADFCSVDLVDEDGEVRRLRVAAKGASRQHLCDALMQTPIGPKHPLLVWSPLESRQPILIEKMTPELAAQWAQSEEQLRLLQELDPRSMIVVPLIARGKVLGILEVVASARSRPYGPADLRLMEEVAWRAALAIDNARLYRAAERAIRTRDEVLGVVAHDLRNPLHGIQMALGLIQQRRSAPEPHAQKQLERIAYSAARMNRLIEDLLDVVRLEAGRFGLEQAPVEAGKLLSEFAEVQGPLASSSSVELRLDAARELGEVFADRDRLLEVLENLVGNAVKFTPPGGRVTVGAAPRNGEVVFWVADTGVGVSRDDVPHLFDRFWQARKADRRGLGLGLPIVKGIVEAHGGRIWVESLAGAGSTFFFALPQRGAGVSVASGMQDPASKGAPV